MELAGTQTLVKDTVAWSVGMFSVHCESQATVAKTRSADTYLVAFDLNTWSVARYVEAGDTLRISVLTTGPRKDEAVGRFVHTGLPHLRAIDNIAAVRLLFSSRLHVRRITSMSRLCQAESNPYLPLQPTLNQFLLLLLTTKMLHHNHIRKVAHDRMFILQVIEETQPLTCKMLSYNRHP